MDQLDDGGNGLVVKPSVGFINERFEDIGFDGIANEGLHHCKDQFLIRFAPEFLPLCCGELRIAFGDIQATVSSKSS